MSKKMVKNVAASVRQKLLNLSRERGEDFQLLLTRYAVERLLYRLSCSQYSNQFILKGATLFSLWGGKSYRTTRDLDLLGEIECDIEKVEETFREICTLEVEDDGLLFDDNTVRANAIQENNVYEGMRITLIARIGTMRIPVQIDIGFGDVVTPDAKEAEFPAILDFPAPKIRTYPPETVIAEKFQSMVNLGIANSRMRDFYDIRTLGMQFPFDGKQLGEAIKNTFARRQTELPSRVPLALTPEFYSIPDKETQWNAFLSKSGLENDKLTIEQTALFIKDFLMPPTLAVSKGIIFSMAWQSGGPWEKK